MLEIYYTPTSAIIADALAKTYEVVSLETARNIAKKFKASLKQKTDLYVIEGILINAGYKKEPVNLWEKCDETGVNIQAVLPHEIMDELGNMISDSLEF